MNIGSPKPTTSDSIPVLSISIDIGDQNERLLEVKEGDDPHQLAVEFCKQSNVPDNYIHTIEQNIIDNMPTHQSRKASNENIEENDEQIKPINSIYNELSEKKQRNYLVQDQTDCQSPDTNERELFKRRAKSIDGTANVWEKLYSKGINKMKENERNAEQTRQIYEEIQNQSLTFAPKINKTAMQKRAGKLEDKLIQYKNISQDKILREKERVQLMEKSLCTFKPDINKESSKMAIERKRQISMETFNHLELNQYDYLYEDSKRRQISKTKVILETKEKECTFHPNREHTKHYHGTSLNYRKRFSKNAISSEQYEMATFRPVTGRSPAYNRNSEGLSIGNYLYNQRNHKQEIVNNIKKSREALENSYFRVEPDDGTESIYERAKLESFEELFRLLDSDNDGKISTYLINWKSSIIIRHSCQCLQDHKSHH